MTSKFAGPPKPQKTPKICHASPPPPSPPDPIFELWPIQGYASWIDPFSPLDGSITGQTWLDPYPASHLHFGIIQGTDNNLELDLLFDPVTEYFTYTIQLMQGFIIVDSVFVTFNDPQPEIPFETELFLFEDPFSSRIVRSRIFS